MKCGTTTLYQLLAKHPRIALPLTKEPRYLAPPRYGTTTLVSYAREFEAAREVRAREKGWTSARRQCEEALLATAKASREQVWSTRKHAQANRAALLLLSYFLASHF